MKIYCTICSRKKSEIDRPINAIDLYLSESIRNIHRASQTAGLEFRILSGKFGLLKPYEKVRPYDYLLVPDAVEELKETVKGQMKAQDISEVVFYGENREGHPGWKPYYDVMIGACREMGIKLDLKEILD